MPLATPKQRTNTGKSPGANVVVGDYDDVFGTSATPPVFVTDGDSAHGVCVDFAGIPAAAGTAMLRDNAAVDSSYGQLTIDFKLTAVPTAAIVLFELRNASAKIFNLLLNVSGGNATVLARGGGDQLLTGQDSTGAVTLAVWSAGVTIALNTWYRIEVAVQVATSTTGKAKARLTRLSDAAVLAQGERQNLNNGTAVVSHWIGGKSSSTLAYAGRLDNAAWQDLAYTYLPAPSGNLTPTAAFTTAVIGADVSVNGTGSSDPDGTIASYAWAFGDGATATGPTASHTYAASGTYTITLTVTDDLGATNAITHEVTVTAEESPAGTERKHTHVTRVPGTVIGNDEYSQVFGTDAARMYASDAGNTVARFGGAGTASGFVFDTHANTMKASWACELVVQEAPSGQAEILNHRSVDSLNVTSVVLYPDRTIRVNNGNGTQEVLVTPALALGTRYVLQLAAQVGTTGSNGKIRARLKTMAGTVLAAAERTDIANGLGLVNGERHGKLGSAVTMVVDVDNVRWFDGSYGWINPAAEESSAGPDQIVEPLTLVTLTGAGTGAWAQTSGDPVTLGGSGNVRTFTAPLSLLEEVYGFTFGTDAMTVTVSPATEAIGPIGGVWVPVRLRTISPST